MHMPLRVFRLPPENSLLQILRLIKQLNKKKYDIFFKKNGVFSESKNSFPKIASVGIEIKGNNV